jgi:lipoprotein-anchoring transpeptidase ErfK/SrfK
MYSARRLVYPKPAMNMRTRDIVILVVGLGLVLAAALGGYAAVRARADGSGARQSLAPVVTPTPGATADQPQYDRWMVGKAVGSFTAFTRPDPGAPVKAELGKLNQNGYPTLVLVDTSREIDGKMWYRVWIAMRPNESRGWVPEDKLAFYWTYTKIAIDLSERRLRVYHRGELKGEYPVAVGKPGWETPTGFFFVNQKLKPLSPGGDFGALAIGISAFQMKISASEWVQGGPIAIHGTNEDHLIGKAISHGCVRMHDKDVLEVSKLVPAGSPVEITK